MSCYKPPVDRKVPLNRPMIDLSLNQFDRVFQGAFQKALSTFDFQAVLRKVLPLLLLVFFFLSARAADPKKGETLFKNNCTSCHALDYKMTGPALKGITSTQSEAWFVKWILNNKKLRDSGDKSAQAIYAEYNQAQMNIFEGILTEGDVKDILAYIKDASVPKTATAVAGGAGSTGTSTSGSTSDLSSSWLAVGGLVLVIIVLFLVIGILNRVIKTLEGLLRRNKGGLGTGTPGTPGYIPGHIGAEEGLLASEHGVHGEHGDGYGDGDAGHTGPKKDPFAGIKKLARNRQVVVLVLLLTTVSLTVLYWDQMLSIGMTQGYQPVQPINYSHKLHAGQLKISCQYCHGGAFKSKNAGIPSANICMNCHAAVQLREKYNGKVSPEISKIYSALDYNPDTKKFGPNKKPIQWVKIHQLQDFVYFNHSQHVKVGGQKCQTCHGPIETMTQVYQYSPLTMSWCINCHKQTPLNTQGNGYYDKMLAMHNEFKHGQKVTVAMMGGIECSKCHY